MTKAKLQPEEQPDESVMFPTSECLHLPKPRNKELKEKWHRHPESPHVWYRDTGMFLETGSLLLHELGKKLDEEQPRLASKLMNPAPATKPNLEAIQASYEFFEYMPGIDFFESSPIEKDLDAVEREIAAAAAALLTKDERAAWDQPGHKSYYGWRRNLYYAKTICKRLRLALKTGNINLAMRKAMELGKEMATFRLRVNFEPAIAAAKRKASASSQARMGKRNAELARKMVAMSELQRRRTVNPAESSTKLLEEMAKEEKWGCRRTLMGYALISQLTSPSESSK